MARVLAVALAALALAGTALAGGNPPKLHGSLAPPSPRLKVAEAKRIFLQNGKVTDWLRHYPRGRQVDADFSKTTKLWTIKVWSGPAGEVATGKIDDTSGAMTEAWTGPQVAWKMARGYPGAFGGREINSYAVWLWFFTRGEIFTSVPLAYPPLLYLLGRMVWSTWRGRLATGAVPVWPVWVLAAATVFAAGFRIGLNVRASNVIDVGYSGVVGADRITRGQVPYGHFPVELGKACGPADADGEIRNHVQTNGRCESANPQGDTYGPVAYEAYLPGYLALGWTGKWDDLPAAHFASIAFDLLCLLGIALVGLRFGGQRLAVTLAFAWVAYPFTQYVSSSNTNDALPPLFLIWGFWLASSPVARGTFSALSGWTKFAPLLLAPLWASYPERRLRSTLVFAGAFLAASLAAFSILALDGHPLGAAHEFWTRTISWQVDRQSPFSIWDWRQYHAGLPDLRLLQRVLEVALLIGAVAVYFFPRRKSPLQLAALTAALLLGFQIVLTHWFYLYLPWFFPFAAFAVLAPAAEPLTAPVRAPLERRRQELVGVD